MAGQINTLQTIESIRASEPPLYLTPNQVDIGQGFYHELSMRETFFKHLPFYSIIDSFHLHRLGQQAGEGELNRDIVARFGEDAEWARRNVSEEDFNEHFKPFGLKWKPNITWAQALVMQEARGYEMALDEGMYHSQGSGWRTAADFFVQMPAELADPINIASAVLVPEAKISQKIIRGAGRMAKVSRAAVAGAIGNSVTEPFLYASNQYRQSDYTLLDSAFNLAAGAAFSGGLRTLPYAFRGAQDALGRASLAIADRAPVADPGTRLARGISALEKFGHDAVYKAKLYKIKELLTDQAEPEKIMVLLDDDQFLDGMINTLSDLDDSIRSLHSQYKEVFVDEEMMIDFIRSNKELLAERMTRLAKAIADGEEDTSINMFEYDELLDGEKGVEIPMLVESIYNAYSAMGLMVEAPYKVGDEVVQIKVPTVLSPDAYRAIRTDQFKEIFGDWENPETDPPGIERHEVTGEPIAVTIDGERVSVNDLFGEGDSANKLSPTQKEEIKKEVRKYARQVQKDMFEEMITRARKLQQLEDANKQGDEDFDLAKWVNQDSVTKESIDELFESTNEAESILRNEGKVREENDVDAVDSPEEGDVGAVDSPEEELSDPATDILHDLLSQFIPDDPIAKDLFDKVVKPGAGPDELGEVKKNLEIKIGLVKDVLPKILDSLKQMIKEDTSLSRYVKENKNNASILIKQLHMLNAIYQNVEAFSDVSIKLFPDMDASGSYLPMPKEVKIGVSAFYNFRQTGDPARALCTFVHELEHGATVHYMNMFFNDDSPFIKKFLKGGDLDEVMDPRSFKGTVVHSGAADGADTIFQIEAEKAGADVKAHSFRGHKRGNPKRVEHTDEELAQADEHLRKANETLGRSFPPSNKFVADLLRRNYFQVKDSSQVVAVTYIENGPNGPQVSGGTAWATQMGIDMGKDVHVFDMNTNKWYEWDGEWKESSPPTLGREFAGIGSRKMTKEGKEAIASLFKVQTTPEGGRRPKGNRTERYLSMMEALASRDSSVLNTHEMQLIMRSFDMGDLRRTFSLAFPNDFETKLSGVTVQEVFDPNGRFARLLAPLRDTARIYLDFLDGVDRGLIDQFPFEDLDSYLTNLGPAGMDYREKWQDHLRESKKTFGDEKGSRYARLQYYGSNIKEFIAQWLIDPDGIEFLSQIRYTNPSEVFHGEWAKRFNGSVEGPSLFRSLMNSIAEVYTTITGKTKPSDQVTAAEALAYTKREMALLQREYRLDHYAKFARSRSGQDSDNDQSPDPGSEDSSSGRFGIPDIPQLQWVNNQADPLNIVKRTLLKEANVAAIKIENAKRAHGAGGIDEDEFLSIVQTHLHKRRRALMDIEVYEAFQRFASGQKNMAEALKIYINGNKSFAGADQRIIALQREAKNDLMDALTREGLDEVFLSDKHNKDIYHATAILDGITEGVDRSQIDDEAFRVAEIIKSVKDRQMAMINMLGGNIRAAKNHARSRRHSPERILRGTEKRSFLRRHGADEAVEQWVDFVLNNNLNFELTFAFTRGPNGSFIFNPNKGVGRAIVDQKIKEAKEINDRDISRKEAIKMTEVQRRARNETEANEMFREYLRETCRQLLDTNRDADKKNQLLMSSHDQMELQRTIIFRGWEDNLKYDEQYSGRSFAEGLLMDLEGRARGLGLMEFFGSNEGAMFNTIQEVFSTEIRQGLKKSKNPLEKMGVLNVGSYFQKLVGEADNPENHTMNRMASMIRAVLIMGQLEKVVVSSIADLASMDSTMRANGIEKVTNIRHDLDKFLKDKEGRDLLIQLGVGAEQWLGEAALRFGYNEHAPGLASNAMRFFFKAVGLQGWNKFNQSRAVSMMSTNLGMNSDKSFSDLDQRLRSSLEKYGISSDEWDILRSGVSSGIKTVGSLTNSENAQYITLDSVNRGNRSLVTAAARKEGVNVGVYRRKLRQKIMTYYSDQMDHSVLMPGNWEMANLHLGTKAGTLSGEAVRMMALYKAFGLATLNKIGSREIAFALAGGGLLSLTAYAGQAIFCGYMSQTITDILNNREARLPTSPEVIMASIKKSGALGIFGDLILGETYAQDKSVGKQAWDNFTGYLGGPVFGVAERMYDATGDILSGSTRSGKRKMFQTVIDNTPFLEYPLVGLALDTLVWDNISDALDPGYERRRNRFLEEMGSGVLFDFEP